ncbi:LOW QUALITY PROTEIN: solute carrier family 22 member 11-like [Glossophaga mutica]
MAFSELLERGGVGRSQDLQVITLLLPSVFVPSQMLRDHFSAATPGHRCWAHMLDNGSESPAALTPEALLVSSIPPGPNHGPHQCCRFCHPQWQLLDPNATATNWSGAATEPCLDGWVYDHSTFTSTIEAERGLECEHQGLKFLGRAGLVAGMPRGSFAWGLLSCWPRWACSPNRFGRMSTWTWCCLQVAEATTSAIFAPPPLVCCGLRLSSAFHRWAVAPMILRRSCSAGRTAPGALAFVLRGWRALCPATSAPSLAIFLLSATAMAPESACAHAARVPAVRAAQVDRIWLPGSWMGRTVLGERLRPSPERLRDGISQPGTGIAEGGRLPSPPSWGRGRVCCLPRPPRPACGLGPACVGKAKTQPGCSSFNRWLPESTRRLISAGKPDRALQELKKVARINGVEDAKKTLTIEVLMSTMGDEVASARACQSPLDLFCLPKLCRRSCYLSMASFSLTISFFRPVEDLHNLGGDIFLLQVLFASLGQAANNSLLKFFQPNEALEDPVPQRWADFQGRCWVVFAVLGKGCFGVCLTRYSVYEAELFPTSLQQMFLPLFGKALFPKVPTMTRVWAIPSAHGMTADGFLQLVGQLGAMLGPLMGMACQAPPLLPALSYGTLPIPSLVLLFLPETRGLPLPDAIQDLENQPGTPSHLGVGLGSLSPGDVAGQGSQVRETSWWRGRHLGWACCQDRSSCGGG